MSGNAIRSILVAGDGIVGLSAALAFARALPGVEVRILGMAPDPAAMADHFTTAMPAIGRFHSAIGIDELDLVGRGIAVHHLGTRFSGPSANWLRSFGEVGRGEGVVPFRQMWLAAKRRGEALPFDLYSPASVIGKAGKFVHPSGAATSPLSTYLYGLRLNPERYRGALLRATEGLARVDGRIASIERRDDGGIAVLRLDDRGEVRADLFVDCSGPGASLIGTADDQFIDWSAYLPARHVAQRWEASDALEPLDHVTPIDGGWQLTATTPGARSIATVTCRPLSHSLALRPGRRRASFVGNVLAIGDASVALDPLQGANLSLAHSAILRAVALFPGRDCHPLELAEYNRLTALELDRARDFHMLFQSQIQPAAAVPDSLARTLTQWRSRGRLPFFEEETFTESDWEQALIGLGVLADEVAPLATAIDPAAAASAMAAYARDIAALAQRLPSYRDYLAGMAARARRPA